jgi:hypothetical protein
MKPKPGAPSNPGEPLNPGEPKFQFFFTFGQAF